MGTTRPRRRAKRPVRQPWAGRLDGRVALVTGSTRGVGKGIALSLGEAGATVYVSGRSVRGRRTTQGLPGTIQDTAEAVSDRGGIGIPVRCDHSKEVQVRRLMERVKREQGRLDILVNNAFAGEEGRRPIVTYDEFPFWKHDFGEYWFRFFDAYLRPSLLTTHHALPLMLRRGEGMIANTLWWNRGRYLCDLFFDVASSGVGRMVHGLSIELRRTNIAAVAISPGWTRTERMSDVPASVLRRETQSPEFVGRAVVHLALDQKLTDKSGQILEVGKLAREYRFRDVDGRRWDYHARFAARRPSGWPAD